jgi:hypothetical protein
MEVRRGCSHVRPTQAHRHFVVEPNGISLPYGHIEDGRARDS